MAEMITLRAYLNELNSMVESESPTEAVSHCRYILQHFPQNVATYRLLGKALLQKGHNEGLPEYFVQATDIFQRVLSVVPDDAVAHLALSEIREQEGALDQAIWHMERAQEQLPGNALIIDALRKLYARQPGYAGGGTDKLQLSRSALARQYANSQLYDQAVLELRYALQTTPSRVDLQLLLAKLLWDSQHTIEAGEVAVEVLKQLPYCLEANALMARLWLAYGRPSDAQPFIDQVEALDPYAAMSIVRPEKSGPDPNLIARLDYSARAAAALSAETPDWVHDLDDLDATYAPVRDEAGAGRGPDRIDTAAIFGDIHDDAPDWLPDSLMDADQSPDWAVGSGAEAQPDLSAAAPLEADWLEGDALASPEDDTGSIPDWFTPLTEAEALPSAPDDSSLVDWLPETEADAGAVDEMASFLAGIEQAGQAEPIEPETEAASSPAFEWMSEPGDAPGEETPPDWPLAAETGADDPLAWLYESSGAEAGLSDSSSVPEAQAAAWLPGDAEPGSEPEPDDWLQAGALIEPHDDPAALGLSAEDDIADLDRLFDMLSAAEASGQEGGPAAPEPESIDTTSEPAEPERVPDPNDWMALFQQPAAEQPEVEPEPALPDDRPEPQPLEWAALFAEETPDEAQAFEAQDLDLPETLAFAEDRADDDDILRQVNAEETVADWLGAPDEPDTPEDPGAGLPLGEGLADTADAANEISEWDIQEAALSSLLNEAAPAADQALLDALSHAGSDEDDWLRQFDQSPAASAAAPDPDGLAEPALPDEDILAIFGGSASFSPADEDGSDAPVEASPLPWSSSDELAADWPEILAEQPASEPPAAGPDAAQWPGWDTGEAAGSDSAAEDLAADAFPGGWTALDDGDQDAAGEGAEGGAPQEAALFAPSEEIDAEDAEPGATALLGLARAVEQVQHEQVPDWMAGLEIPERGPTDEEINALIDESYDPFEGGDPANVPTYESAGHTGILQPNEEPDWMRAFTGELTSEPEAAADDADDFGFSGADLLDDGPEDALAAFDAIALTRDERPAEPALAPAFDAVDWDMPGDDLILGVESEPRADAEADLPDWLSAITQAAPDPASVSELDADKFTEADFDAQTAPDWLRHVDEASPDMEWAALDGLSEADSLAHGGDFADTLSDALADLEMAARTEPEGEGEFDDTFSFADRLPTWLRRTRNQSDE